VKKDSKASSSASVILVQDAVLVRMALAAYLRDCGYRVIEAATSDEALLVLQNAQGPLNVLFSDAEVAGALDAFALAQWVRKNRPDIKVVMAGSPTSASAVAGRLCEEGPHLKKPYEPQLVEDYIRKLLALQSTAEPR